MSKIKDYAATVYQEDNPSLMKGDELWVTKEIEHNIIQQELERSLKNGPRN